MLKKSLLISTLLIAGCTTTSPLVNVGQVSVPDFMSLNNIQPIAPNGVLVDMPNKPARLNVQVVMNISGYEVSSFQQKCLAEILTRCEFKVDGKDILSPITLTMHQEDWQNPDGTYFNINGKINDIPPGYVTVSVKGYQGLNQYITGQTFIKLGQDEFKDIKIVASMNRE